VGSLYIFDESDEFMLEELYEFHHLTKGCPVIALTATPGERGHEKLALTRLGFKSFKPPKGL